MLNNLYSSARRWSCFLLVFGVSILFAQESMPFQINSQILNQVSRSVISIKSITLGKGRPEIHIGTGFIIHSDGYAVTSHSVVFSADELQVTLHDASVVRAVLIYENVETGIAILKLKGTTFTPVELQNQRELKYPACLTILGNSLGFFPSVTMAMLERKSDDGLLHLGALIPPGNSGSPVFNGKGNLVGMLMGRTSFKIHQSENMPVGLALPAYKIAMEINSLIDHFIKHPGWVGLSVDDLSSQHGVVVTNVSKDGPAERAGVSVGDTIVAFQGIAFKHALDLELCVTSVKPDTEITFTIMKNGNRMNYLVIVQKRNWFLSP